MILFLHKQDLGLISSEVLFRCHLVILIHTPDQFEILKCRHSFGQNGILLNKEELDELVNITLQESEFIKDETLDTPSKIS